MYGFRLYRLSYLAIALSCICFMMISATDAKALVFPSTPILDDFNRPDQGPPGGPNWISSLSSEYPGHGGLSVKDLKAVGATISESYSSSWSTRFGQDQEAYYSYGDTPGTHAGMGPAVRLKDPTDFQSDQYLVFFYQRQGLNNAQAKIWKHANGGWSLIAASDLGVDLWAGDQIGIRAIGNKVEAFLNGQVVASVVDQNNPVLGPGYIQLYVGDDVGHTADDFGGGEVVLAPTQSPELTDPAPGSELSGSTVTFTWRDNGTAVSEWWLEVGHAPGENDIHDSGPFDSGQLSQTVSGLPTDGSAVHLRLWHRTAIGSWESSDVQYTATLDVNAGKKVFFNHHILLLILTPN